MWFKAQRSRTEGGTSAFTHENGRKVPTGTRIGSEPSLSTRYRVPDFTVQDQQFVQRRRRLYFTYTAQQHAALTIPHQCTPQSPTLEPSLSCVSGGNHRTARSSLGARTLETRGSESQSLVSSPSRTKSITTGKGAGSGQPMVSNQPPAAQLDRHILLRRVPEETKPS